MAWWYVETVRDQDEGDSMILTEEEAAELDRLNTEEEVKKRKQHDADAAYIISNALNAKVRTEYLNLCARGELGENWKEELARG